MILKINQYAMIVVLIGFLSCKKEDRDSDLIFSETCDFSGSEVEVVDKLTGSLSYTDNVSGLAFPGGGHKFVINSPGLLPMVVCNMPAKFEMEEDASKNVTFSGHLLVLPEEIDAMNTDIELNYLKFE